MSPGENAQCCSRSCAPWWGTCHKQGGVPVSALSLQPPEAHYKDFVASIFFFLHSDPRKCWQRRGEVGQGRGESQQCRGGVELALAEQKPAVNRVQSHQKPLEGAWDTLQQGGQGRLEVFIRHCCPCCVHWFRDVSCLNFLAHQARLRLGKAESLHQQHGLNQGCVGNADPRPAGSEPAF